MAQSKHLHSKNIKRGSDKCKTKTQNSTSIKSYSSNLALQTSDGIICVPISFSIPTLLCLMPWNHTAFYFEQIPHCLLLSLMNVPDFRHLQYSKAYIAHRYSQFYHSPFKLICIFRIWRHWDLASYPKGTFPIILV